MDGGQVESNTEANISTNIYLCGLLLPFHLRHNRHNRPNYWYSTGSTQGAKLHMNKAPTSNPLNHICLRNLVYSYVI